MGNLDDTLAADAAMFIADFGEMVTVWPDGCPPRTVRALVDRQPPADVLSSDLLDVPVIVVDLPANPVTGIVPAAVQPKSWAISVANNHGGELVKRPITKVLSSDAGMIRVALVR